MFLLDVAESAVCVCGLFFDMANLLTMNVAKHPVDIALTVSIFVLVFDSIERLVAARRPHAFTLNAHRAKLALCCGGCD